MANDPSTEAQSIYVELTTAEAFPSVAVDITSTDFALPSTVGNPLYVASAAVTVEKLTDKNPDGVGVFDVIMKSVRNHIGEEYDLGHISAQEYASVYVQMTTAALQTATQFLIQKDAATYTNALIQMQAREAEIKSVIAAAMLAQQRQSLVLTEIQVLTAKAEYALNKMRLATEDITYTKIEKDMEVSAAQKLQIEAQTNIAGYQLTDIMPEEKAQLQYQTTYVLPAGVAKTNYETTQIMPQQRDSLLKDVAIKTYQLASLLPEQLILTKEQVEVQRAQTMDTRVNGVTAITGAIGKQKDLYDQQIDSYIKDARHKSAKFWIDAWITQKSLDEGLAAPSEFTNSNVDEVLASLKLDLGLT